MPLHRGRARRRLPHWHVHGWFTGMLLALRSLLFSSGPRARHDGWYEPEGLLRGEVLDVPVVWTYRFPGAVEKTLALPRLQLVEKSPLVVSDCRKLRIFRSCSSSRSLSSCRDAEAHPHGPCDHSDSPVAFRHGGQWPRCAGRAGFLPSQVVDIPVVVPRLTPMVLTVPSCVDKVVDAPFCRGAGRRQSCRDTEADPRGLSDQSDSPVARGHVVDAPFMQVVHTPVVCNDKPSTSLS